MNKKDLLASLWGSFAEQRGPHLAWLRERQAESRRDPREAFVTKPDEVKVYKDLEAYKAREARADRFVWKPGDLRLTPPEMNDNEVEYALSKYVAGLRRRTGKAWHAEAAYFTHYWRALLVCDDEVRRIWYDADRMLWRFDGKRDRRLVTSEPAGASDLTEVTR